MDSVMNDVVSNLKVMCIVYTNSRSEAVVEGTFTDVGWIDVSDVTDVKERHRVARIIGFYITLLSSQVKLHITQACIT